MEKVLIIGAGGNLGQELSLVFEDKFEVIAWDKGEIDITDKELVMKKVEDLKPSVIINAAAYNAMDKCEDNDDEYEVAKKVNIDGTRNLAEAALLNNAVIVHFSTDYVFDGEKTGGYEETDEPNPISRYGKTKKFGEKAIIELSGKGLKWFLIRTSKLFGRRGESDVAKESFFDLILRLSQEKKDFDLVDGEEISCFTYTADLARAVRQLIEEDYGFGIYHLVNEGPASWYEGAKYLFELKGITDVNLHQVTSENYKRPAKRPKFSVLLNTKFPKLRSWKEALAEYLS